jgi:hypothetical protein
MLLHPGVFHPLFSNPFPAFPVPRSVHLFLSLLLVISAGATPGVCAPAPRPEGAPPSLVVVIVIDQLRGDYMARFREHFVPGGFRLLLDQGANFTDGRYRHAVTKTAAGHAVVLTGVHADIHGIIDNAWIDRESLQRITCVEDDSVALLGLPNPSGGARPPKGASPHQMLTTTIGDELKLWRGDRSKVIGVASKDRSAILLAGKLGDAAYWMDKGRMVSSTHYMKELPAWVRAFNDAGRVDSFFGKTWDRLLPVALYDSLQGPDEAAGEGVEFGMPATFPKRVDGGAAKISPAYYGAFDNSPFKSEVMMDFARALVEQENLGGRGVTDMLCLGFSVNDTVGHNYGADSHEVMDITLRTDRMLADFFVFLDQRVGLKNCTIVLTADHGISPLPERVKAASPHVSAGRVDNVRLLKAGEDALNREFGPLTGGRRWLMVHESSVLFHRGVLEEKKVAPAVAERVVRDALLTVDFVAVAYTRTDLTAGTISGPFAAATLLSFHRERSADVYYHMKPFWVDRKAGTNHGTPYTYDVHVPLLWYGRGVKPGVYTQRVGIDDIAPTLAHILGLVAPPMSQGNVLF